MVFFYGVFYHGFLYNGVFRFFFSWYSFNMMFFLSWRFLSWYFFVMVVFCFLFSYNGDFAQNIALSKLENCQVSEGWVDCLLEEYFHQSDKEKKDALPVAPFMDRFSKKMMVLNTHKRDRWCIKL